MNPGASACLILLDRMAEFIRVDGSDSGIRFSGIEIFKFIRITWLRRDNFSSGILKAPSLDTVLRTVRILVGSFILLTILTAILIPQILPVSGNSFVNAKLEWIRTPIEGDLYFHELRIGDKVSRGTALGKVTNERADDFFLNQLKSEKSSLEAALFTLQNRHLHLTQQKDSLESRVTDSLDDLRQKNSVQLEMIENDIALAAEELVTVNDRLARFRQANADYQGGESYAVVSRSAIDALVNRKNHLQTLISSKKTAIKLSKSSLESALNRTFVSEHTPLELQQVMEIELALMSIETEIDSLNLKSEKLSSQIDERMAHLEKNTNHELVAGVSGTVWDLGFSDGSYVNHGDSIIAIADTETIMVEGNFHQRYLDNVQVGDPATVALTGSDKRLSGLVSEVKIRDQIKSADLSAFNLESPDTNEFKVIVTLNSGEAEDVFIGQRARLIISKSSSSIIPSILLFYKR